MSNYIKYLEETYSNITKVKDWSEAIKLYVEAIILQLKLLLACVTGFMPVILFLLVILLVPYFLIRNTIIKFNKALNASSIVLYEGETFKVFNTSTNIDELSGKLMSKANVLFFVYVAVASFMLLPITITTFHPKKIYLIYVIVAAILPSLVYLICSVIVYAIEELNSGSDECHLFLQILIHRLKDGYKLNTKNKKAVLYEINANMYVAISKDSSKNILPKLSEVNWHNMSNENIISTLKQLMN